MRRFRRFILLEALIVLLSTLVLSPAVAADSDYNYDGTSDILFQHSVDGRLLIWTMSDFNRSVRFVKSLATTWGVEGKGDFNGDGTSDVLYLKDAGDTAIALMNNAARSSLVFPGGINLIWSVQGIGDFNGDGTDDILWRRVDGVTMVWGMNNGSRTTVAFPGGLATFWRVAGVGDFNNDGTDDILYQHISDGRLLIWQMNNHSRTTIKFAKSLANAWTVAGVGDFNNDGTDDVLYRKDAGDVAIAEFSNLNRSALKFLGGIGTTWQITDAGDYNGDSTDDILFCRSTDNVTVIWGVNNSNRSSINFSGGLAVQWVVQPDLPPISPTGLTASNLTATSATLNWADNSDNETFFQIGTWSNGSFLLWKTAGVNVTSTALSLTQATTYTFYVRAVNDAGYATSAGITFTTPTSQQTLTLATVFDNLVMSNSLDGTVANTVYNNAELAIGCNWDYGFYTGQQFLCGASTIYFNAGVQVSGKTIDSAVLEMEVDYIGVGYYPRNWNVYALAESWNTYTITWNILTGMNIYTASKQTYLPPTYAGQIYRIDLKATVQNWANGTYDDNGLSFQIANTIFPYVTSLDAFAFYSNEDSLNPPKLIITYH